MTLAGQRILASARRVLSFFRDEREEKTPPEKGGAVSTENERNQMFALTQEASESKPALVVGSVGKTPAHKKVRWWIQNPPDAPIKLRITPDLAAEMLEYNTDNRPVSPGTVEKYASQMQRGEWHTTYAPIVFSKKGRIIDGQHRLHAAVKAAVSFDAWVAFGDADENFAFMDVGKPRGASDIFAINGVKNSALMAGATRWVMGYDHNSMSGGNSGLSYSPTPAQVYDFFTANRRIADSTHIGFKFRDSRLAQPSMMVGLHYICARKNRALADEFFDKLGTGIGFANKTEPVYRLHKRLMENVTKNERLKPVVMAAFTLIAWNATRTGQPLGILRWRGEQNPQQAFPKAI